MRRLSKNAFKGNVYIKKKKSVSIFISPLLSTRTPEALAASVSCRAAGTGWFVIRGPLAQALVCVEVHRIALGVPFRVL